MFDPNGLRVFVEVVRRGSFVRASNSLEMPTSSVSRKVAQLEASLNKRLLNRSTRTVSLTEVGQRYFSQVSAVVDAIDAANNEITSGHFILTGLLQIVLEQQLAHGLLLSKLFSFKMDNPKIIFDLSIVPKINNINCESSNLTLCADSLVQDGLETKRIGCLDMCLCAAPDYIRTHPSPVRPNDLKSHVCLTYALTALNGYWKFKRRGDNIVVPISSDLNSNDLSVLIHAALSGAGIAYLPESSVQSYIKKGTLVRVLDVYEHEKLNINLVFSNKNLITPQARALIEYLSI